MHKVNKRVEDIFAHAAALQQNGRMRNTIYCRKKYIYILNQDDTILLKFRLRASEVTFAHPISFHANDYDSNQFYEKDGYIHFVTENETHQRIKRCGVPAQSPSQIHHKFQQLKPSTENAIEIGDSLLGFLDESLTHIEFSVVKGVLKIVQRNIYTGSIITIQEKSGQNNLVQTSSHLKDFAPIAIRTKDFFALFSFTNVVSFCFGSDYIWVENKNHKTPYVGVVGLCKYNELQG
jgi:hypothetical protein